MELEKALAAAAAAEVGGTVDDSMEKWIEGFLGRYSRRHAGASVQELQEIMRTAGPEGVLDAIQKRMETWVDSADRKAEDKITQSDGAVAREIWRRNGVTKITWQGAGAECPLCGQLDGKVIGIEESFVKQGEGVEAEGHGKLWAGADILHPPLHKGCGCSIGIG
jgi:hypothetical protein